jgi:uncharacterized repeat protein (TIGR03803 family)
MRKNLMALALLFSTAGLHAQLKLYGTTASGGDSSAGVIFSINSDGSDYQLLYTFKGGTDGNSPTGTLSLGLDTKLYGLTTGGGISNGGIIFSYDTLAHVYKKLADLGTATGFDIGGGSLVWYKDRFYGLGTWGGANGNGTLFSYNPTTGVLADVYDLTTATGAQPYGRVTVLNGLLYFATHSGGANSGGVMDVYDPVGGTVTNLFDFPSGYGPSSNLTTISDTLYGVSGSGGDPYYRAGSAFFFYSGTKTFKDLFDYTIFYGGVNPTAMAAFHGLLFGMTTNGGANQNGGTIEFINPVSRGQSQMYAWDYNNNPAAGGFPFAPPVITNDALLLGMTANGGIADSGVIFSFDLHSKTYTRLLDFTGANGANPGTSFLLIPGLQQILAVRIIQFTGLLTDAGRVLNWTATQMAEGGWFELERSTDAVNFAGIDSVATVSGPGDAVSTGAGSGSYTYTDDAALPGVKVAYYRLKMTDVSQVESYSNVVAIGLGNESGDSLRLINTAVTGTAFLQYKSAGASSTLNMRVVGMNGELWIQQELPVSAGVNSYSITTTALPKGMYILQAAGRSIKFVKL